MTLVFFLFSVAMAKPKPGDPHSSHPSTISDKLSPSHPSKIATSGINQSLNGKLPIKYPAAAIAIQPPPLPPLVIDSACDCKKPHPVATTTTRLPATKPTPLIWISNIQSRAPKVDPSHQVYHEANKFKGLNQQKVI